MKKKMSVVIFSICAVFSKLCLAEDIWPVGSIIHSLLHEKDFQVEMGQEWVLLDGRPISPSDDISPYLDGLRDQYGNLFLPNAQGKFLRMKDYRTENERIDSGDPENNRVIGSYQADELKSHSHDYRSTDNGRLHDNPYNTFAVPRFGEVKSKQTSVTGGVETRPRNIAVNMFVKIRNCQSTRCK